MGEEQHVARPHMFLALLLLPCTAGRREPAAMLNIVATCAREREGVPDIELPAGFVQNGRQHYLQGEEQ